MAKPRLYTQPLGRTARWRTRHALGMFRAHSGRAYRALRPAYWHRTLRVGRFVRTRKFAAYQRKIQERKEKKQSKQTTVVKRQGRPVAKTAQVLNWAQLEARLRRA
jgi:hypothetical protein